MVGGDPGDLQAGAGLLHGGRQDRVLPRRPWRRGAVRRGPGNTGPRLRAPEREAPPGRGGDVGRRFRVGEVPDGRRSGVRGDPRDRSRARAGPLARQGSGYVPEFESEDAEGGSEGGRRGRGPGVVRVEPGFQVQFFVGV